MPDVTIERLRLPASEADIRSLSELLCDTVDSGAAVSFLAPLPVDEAAAWWRKTLAGADSRSAFLVARDPTGIVGTVQMHPSWAPNQPHRGDIAKLMVHRRARRHGIASQLMRAAEDAAREAGLTLLTLDTRAGEGAETLYRRTGWTCAGVIPRFAVNADRSGLHDTVIFYKEL